MEYKPKMLGTIQNDKLELLENERTDLTISE